MNNRVLSLAGATLLLSIPGGMLTAVAAVEELNGNEPIAEIQHNNGARITVNGEMLDFGEADFPILAGDIIEFDRGFTDFNLSVADPEAVTWQVDVFPGDSFAFFGLDDFAVNTDEPLSETTALSSGQGEVIAYGFDPDNSKPVVLQSLQDDTQAVPEPHGLLGLVLLAGGIRWGWVRNQPGDRR